MFVLSDSDFISFDAHSELSADSRCNSAPGSPPKVTIEPAAIISYNSPTGSPKTARKRLTVNRRPGVFTCPSLDFIKERSPNPADDTSPAPITALFIGTPTNLTTSSNDSGDVTAKPRKEVPKFVFPEDATCSDTKDFLPSIENKTVPFEVTVTVANAVNQKGDHRKQSVPEIRVAEYNGEVRLEDDSTKQDLVGEMVEERLTKPSRFRTATRRHSGSDHEIPGENNNNKETDKRDSGYISSDCPGASLGASLMPESKRMPTTADHDPDSRNLNRDNVQLSNEISDVDPEFPASKTPHVCDCDTPVSRTKNESQVCDKNIPSEQSGSNQAEEDLICRAAIALSSPRSNGCEAWDQSPGSDSDLSEEGGISLPDHLSPGLQSRRGSSLSGIDKMVTELHTAQHSCEHSQKELPALEDKTLIHIALPEGEKGVESRPITPCPLNTSAAANLGEEKELKTSIDRVRTISMASNESLDSSDGSKLPNPFPNHLKCRLRHSIDLGVTKENEPLVTVNGWCKTRDTEDLCPLPRLRSNTLASKTVIRKASLDLTPMVRCESASANLESLLDDEEDPVEEDNVWKSDRKSSAEKNLISFESNLSLNQARLYTIHDTCFRRSTLLDQSLEDLHFKRCGIKPLVGRKRTRQSSGGSIDVPLDDLVEDGIATDKSLCHLENDFSKCSSCAGDNNLLKSPPADCLVEPSS